MGKFAGNRYVIAESLEAFFTLLADLHLDPRLKMTCDGTGLGDATWDGNRETMTTGLLSLLPLLYREGRLYQPKPHPTGA